MEIKFRAWSKSENKYIYDFSMSNDGGVVLNKCYGTDNYIVEQYTGFKASPATEIYEGDLFIDDHHGLCVIEYSELFCAFMMFLTRDKKLGCPLHHANRAKIKIIGNIHENNDLLKGE